MTSWRCWNLSFSHSFFIVSVPLNRCSLANFLQLFTQKSETGPSTRTEYNAVQLEQTCSIYRQFNLVGKFWQSSLRKKGQLVEQFSYHLEKWFRQEFVICFITQWIKRSKHGLFFFPPKKKPNMGKALFFFPPKKNLIWRRHCSISQSCCSMKSKRSIGWFLESSPAWRFII